ncbi:DUF5518 domain-containing protein [Halomarina salina]|uniref:DUF5518 domain-containing protein n=1 Tax=Halomarina salina TaxID=1872699 RepID=A0ABD5RLY0_9EURY|nr:DUF5518 domain-containing protein [Halomarina salina]
MGTSQTTTESVGRSSATAGRQPRLPRYVDWLVAAVVGLSGLVSGLGGSALLLLADVDRIATLVAEGAIRSDVLSGPQLVDATYAVLWWTGVGLLVTGLALVVAAVGYVVYRRREERRLADTVVATRSVGTNAVVGALATVVFGFVPFSPVLGGAVSGYLAGGEQSGGLTAGGLSGLLASLPFVSVLAFVTVGIVVGTTGALELGGALVLASIVLGSTLFGVLVVVGLGALGGYAGQRL